MALKEDKSGKLRKRKKNSQKVANGPKPKQGYFPNRRILNLLLLKEECFQIKDLEEIRYDQWSTVLEEMENNGLKTISGVTNLKQEERDFIVEDGEKNRMKCR